MSFFYAPSSSAGGTGGLFDSGGSSDLFGGGALPSQSSTSNIFGNLGGGSGSGTGGASTGTTSGSIFGSSSQPTSASNSTPFSGFTLSGLGGGLGGGNQGSTGTTNLSGQASSAAAQPTIAPPVGVPPFSLSGTTLGSQNTGQSSNLFGGAGVSGALGGTSQPASAPNPALSLFSGLGGGQTTSTTATQPTSAVNSNPFGNLGGLGAPTSTAKPGGTSNLFGALGGGQTSSSATTQPVSTAPLNAFPSFGQAASAPSLQPAQPAQPGLLSGLGGSKPQTSTNTFGQNPFPSQSEAPKVGVFTSLLGNNAQNQSLAASQAHAAKARDTVQTAYFNSLLEKNKKRTRGVEETHGLDEIPGLNLGLGDISKRVRELGNLGGSGLRDKAADTKAHYLLAASGVNPGKTLKDLNNFSAQAAAQPLEPIKPEFEVDSHKYVEQLQQSMTLKMINDGLERANRRFENFLQDHIEMNWDEQRRRVYEHFGLTPRNADDPNVSFSATGRGGFGKSSRKTKGPQGTPNGSSLNRSVFGQSGMQKSVIGSPAVGQGNLQIFGHSMERDQQPPIQEDRFTREKQGKFAEKVQRLNESRLQEAFYPLLREFGEVDGAISGDSPSQVLDAYKALIEITAEDNMTEFKSRNFADEYLDENMNSDKSARCRQKILQGSRKALEKQFYDHLATIVTRNVKEASLGGVPTRINRIRAYIRVRIARKDLVPDGTHLQQMNEDYCWALIFYLLRCGFVEEAAQYVAENANAFKAIDRMFAAYITTFARSSDRRLTTPQQAKINTEYMQRTRLAPDNQTDPYRLACYKVIGRCELSKRSLETISQGVEDWMWLQFCLAREANRAEELATDVYGLREVQTTVKEIGQRHFGKGSDTSGYGTFFYLQILGGLFENAVEFLYSHNYVSAVHFAIALDFYGLLRVSDFNTSESDLLTYTTREQPQLNFGRMIGYYTRDFRASNVVAATDYLCLICLNSSLPGELGKAQANLCHEALRELVLETREFATLLGDIYADGTRVRGAIEVRLPLIDLPDQEAYLRTVTIQAARVADDSGRTTDAVLLYHLAEDYNNVISILNRALSDAIAVDYDAEPIKVQPLKPREKKSDPIDQDGGDREKEKGSSLSLVAVDDPIQLARHFVDLYHPNAAYYEKISPVNRDVCGLLMRLSDAKKGIEAGAWGDTLDHISTLNLIPLSARGSIPAIRHSAQALSSLPQTVSRLIGTILLWAITCISKQREKLLSDAGELGPDGRFDGEGGGYGAYESSTRNQISQQLVVQAKDLMIFAGLIKLRLGHGVFERIVVGCAEVGVY